MKKMRVYETPVVQVVNLSSCAQLVLIPITKIPMIL